MCICGLVNDQVLCVDYAYHRVSGVNAAPALHIFSELQI